MCEKEMLHYGPKNLGETFYDVLGLSQNYKDDLSAFLTCFDVNTTNSDFLNSNKEKPFDSFENIIVFHIKTFLCLTKTSLSEMPQILFTEYEQTEKNIESVALNHYSSFVSKDLFMHSLCDKMDRFVKYPSALKKVISEIQFSCESANDDVLKFVPQLKSLDIHRKHCKLLHDLFKVLNYLDNMLQTRQYTELFCSLEKLSPVMARVQLYEKTPRAQEFTGKLPTIGQKLLSKYQECLLLTRNFLLHDLREASKENTHIILGYIQQFKQIEFGSDMAMHLPNLDKNVVATLCVAWQKKKYEIESLQPYDLTNYISASIALQTHVPLICSTLFEFFSNGPLDGSFSFSQWIKEQVQWFLREMHRFFNSDSFGEISENHFFIHPPFFMKLCCLNTRFANLNNNFYIKPSVEEYCFYEKHKKFGSTSFLKLQKAFLETNKTCQLFQKFQCNFFYLTQYIFANYMKAFIRVEFDQALCAFQTQLCSHKWKSVLESTVTAQSAREMISKQPILAEYINALLFLFSDLGSCALSSLSHFMYNGITCLLIETCRILYETAFLSEVAQPSQKTMNDDISLCIVTSTCNAKLSTNFLTLCSIFRDYGVNLIYESLAIIYPQEYGFFQSLVCRQLDTLLGIHNDTVQ